MLRRPCTLIGCLLYKRAAVVTCLSLQLGSGRDRPNITRGSTAQHCKKKRPTTLNWRLHCGVGKQIGTEHRSPRKRMPSRSRTTQNMSVMPSQVESRPTMPQQQQPNQTKGVNRLGAEPQPQPRVPTDNANIIEVLQALQHSQQQMMEEIRQLKTYKTKEKGSQHDLEHATDKEEMPAGGVPQHAEHVSSLWPKQQPSWNKRGPEDLRRGSMHENLHTH